MNRRTFLRVTGAGALASLAGCTGGGDTGTPEPDENEVFAGPNNRYVFQPETLTVSPGTTVTWTFQSPNHNVSCRPESWGSASHPEGAEPFSSYDDGNSFETLPEGESYEHTFDVAGTYDYVCVPHVKNGMIGTVVVEE
jgi:plastocyanin